MTVPMIWGLLSMITYNVVDTIFIGKLGTTYLAAISFTFPVSMVITNLAIGLGVGASSVVARAAGENNLFKLQQLTTSSLILAVSVVMVCAGIGFFTIKPLFVLLGAQPDMIPIINDYMSIWYFGIIFLVVPMVGNFIIRATGDMFWPGIIMAVSSVINLILDPIFIFGLFGFPRMEVKGAALATLIAWAFSFSCSCFILYFREKLINFRLPWPVIKNAWKSILYIAVPAAGTNMIIPLGMGIIMNMISSYGKEAVAAYGAASRVEMFALVIFMAMSSVIGPFVGQNIGVNKHDRILKALSLCYKFCLYFGLFGSIVLAVFSNQIIHFFDSNPIVMEYGRIYFLMVPIGYFGQGIVYISSGVFNGSGHPIPATLISVTRMFILTIPLAIILKYFFGLYGIFSAPMIANLIMGCVASYWSFKHIKNDKCGKLEVG